MSKKIPKKRLNPLVVEHQEIIAERHTKSIELVRLARVKYEGNDFTFIDVRVFQRAYDNDGNEVFHATKRGVQMKESDFLKLIDPFLIEKPKATSKRKIH